MSDNRTARMSAAVDSCLGACLRGPKTPRAILSDYLEQLQEDGAWSDQELDHVRSTVLRLLNERARSTT
jgi:hypothetical protein